MKWLDAWFKLTCPNGHELQSYTEIVNGRLYGFCDVCGEPYAFDGIPIDVPPHSIPIPPDNDDKLFNPPTIEE